MNKSTFIQLLKNPGSTSTSELKELEEVVTIFPYCQAAHILLAKIAHDSGNMLSDKRLKTAAAYTADRRNLKNLINKKHSTVEVIDSNFHEANESSKEETSFFSTDSLTDKIDVDQPSIIPLLDSKLYNEEEELDGFADSIIEDISTKPNPGPDPVTEPIKELPVAEPKVLEPADYFQLETPAQDDKESFFTDLKKNLERLRELKQNITSNQGQEISKSDFIEKKEQNSPLTENLIQEVIAQKPILDKKEKPTEQSQFYASRLGEVVVGKNEDIPVLKARESDLLLKYLEYLDKERKKVNKKQVDQIINKFIKEDPVIPYMQPNSLPDQQEDLTKDIGQKAKEPVSENYAKILIVQKKYFKAIDIYQQLSLKNPEKSAYFAGLIEEVKKKYNI